MSHFFKLGAALRRDAAVQPTTGALRCDSASSCDSGVRAASPQAGSNLFRVSVALGTVRPVEPAAGLSTSEPAGSLVPASPSISPYAPTATIADAFHICKRERIDKRRTTTRPYNSIKRPKREDDTKYARVTSSRLFQAALRGNGRRNPAWLVSSLLQVTVWSPFYLAGRCGLPLAKLCSGRVRRDGHAL